ncbi:hypothetical protein GCM10007978_41450 [Shewanella hanedai]|uniref:DUF2971 domain-containing protein n=1 Tax=Shewanella hanedai TaxID=25 RepID=A0A553JIM2_SHEHA|nr:DUF2971 domain-containing protein [Shewanella hanedai]TRY12311.1 DUF2971 domain-containing protein [Shewanella hanedai]GGI99365.1 hypothetical protein GCM10007978_41450 [Shewanella hanedai]
MILYKYMSFSSARAVIDNNSIGFSCLEDLNDPFESAALCFEKSDELPNNSQYGPHRSRLSQMYGVLSLTRNPLNALMWAHYGDDHRGVVVGIDMDKAGLNDPSKSVIPAKFGEIIYTSSIPRNHLPTPTMDSWMNIGNQFSSFHEDNYDLFKNAFLYKDLAWGYEEEVRVVKNIIDPNGGSRYKKYSYSNSSGNWLQIQHQGRPVCCLSIPQDSIVEAYFGFSSHKNVTRLGVDESVYHSVREQFNHQGVDVKLVRRKTGTWSLEVSDFVV